MPYANPDALVSTDWLAAHLAAPDVRVVDATWYFPGRGKDARAEYEQAHIPGAVYFDIDDIADGTSSLPHMLPDAAKFASRVRKLGLDNGNRVVVYDRAGGSAAAARVWWTFRVFGHSDVCLLDGGITKWLREQRPTEDLPPMPRERHFVPRVNQLLVRNKQQMKANMDARREQVVDARSARRFAGLDPEPWPHNRVGHIPGSLNVPWNGLVDAESETFLPARTLAARFAEAGVDLGRPIVASCGSGVTACVLAFGLYLLGHCEAAVYDGSWAEWGSADDTVAVTG
jgi:thiosulfate/3-mercaptopyruvate sulfurtransferase